MKKIIVTSMAVLISLTLATGCGNKKKNNVDNNKVETEKPQETEEVKINNEEEVVKDQLLETLKFEKTSLIYDGNSTLESTVTNQGNESVYLSRINIYVMNGDNLMVVLHGYIGDNIEPGETRLLSHTYGDDITAATSIRYEIVRE